MSYILQIQRNARLHALAYEVCMALARHRKAVEKSCNGRDDIPMEHRAAVILAHDAFLSEWDKGEL